MTEKRRQQVRAAQKRYADKHPERLRGLLSWQKDNPERVKLRYRRGNLRRKFGISLEQYEAMLIEQGGVCASCGNPETVERLGTLKSLAVDHNHKTGAVRGLLCCRCNTAAGLLEENPKLFRRLLRYLEKYDNYAPKAL